MLERAGSTDVNSALRLLVYLLALCICKYDNDRSLIVNKAKFYHRSHRGAVCVPADLCQSAGGFVTQRDQWVYWLTCDHSAVRQVCVTADWPRSGRSARASDWIRATPGQRASGTVRGKHGIRRTHDRRLSVILGVISIFCHKHYASDYN